MGRQVHLDRLGADFWGPLGGYVAVFICIDGRLEGAVTQFGCSLGFGGGHDGPAIAKLGPDRLVVVSQDEPTAVEVWTTARRRGVARATRRAAQ